MDIDVGRTQAFFFLSNVSDILLNLLSLTSYFLASEPDILVYLFLIFTTSFADELRLLDLDLS